MYSHCKTRGPGRVLLILDGAFFGCFLGNVLFLVEERKLIIPGGDERMIGGDMESKVLRNGYPIWL